MQFKVYVTQTARLVVAALVLCLTGSVGASNTFDRPFGSTAWILSVNFGGTTCSTDNPYTSPEEGFDFAKSCFEAVAAPCSGTYDSNGVSITSFETKTSGYVICPSEGYNRGVHSTGYFDSCPAGTTVVAGNPALCQCPAGNQWNGSTCVSPISPTRRGGATM